MNYLNRNLSLFFLINAILITAKIHAESNSNENTNKYECEIVFELGKSNINENELEQCIKQVPTSENINYVQIISSANQLGSFSYNKDLSKRRLEAVNSYLKKHYKNVITKFVSVGKNSQLDKKVYIIIITNKKREPEIKIVEKQIIIEKEKIIEKIPPKKEESNIDYFITLRLGRDIYMHDQIMPYFSYGFLGGINVKTDKNILYELGLSGNQLVNDDILTITTAYAFAGSYLISNKHNGFFIGIRGLGGAVLNQKNEIDADYGGEGRLGYRNSYLLTAVAIGRTTYTTRVGFELSFYL